MSRYDDQGRRQGRRQGGGYPEGRAQQGGYSEYGQDRYGRSRNGPRRPHGDDRQHHASEQDFGPQSDYDNDPILYAGQWPWSDERDWDRRNDSFGTGSRDWTPQGPQHGDAHRHPRGPGNRGTEGGAGSDVFGPRGSNMESGQSEQGRFDPDYHQWRNEQLRTLDDDYRNWRQDRYKKFSDEFSNWRKNRPSSGSESDSGNAGSKAGHK